MRILAPLLRIRVVGRDLRFRGGTVHVDVRDRKGTACVMQRDLDASSEIVLRELRPDGRRPYRVTVTATDLPDPHVQFVRLPCRADVTMVFVIPRKEEQPPAPQPKPAENVHTVTGIVAAPARGGVEGLRVVIVDKSPRQDVILVETSTGDDGRYEARFSALAVAAEKKGRPDLEARVYAAERFLAASDTHYNAGWNGILDVALPSDSVDVPSEYETLARAIDRHFGGRPAELQENDERQDIAYVAHKSGWDGRAFALAALADQFSSRPHDGAGPRLDPELYYALFRAGVPADAPTLYSVDAESVAEVWKQAIEGGVIPRSLEQQLPQAVEAFRAIGAAEILAAPPRVGISSPRSILEASGIVKPEKQQRLLALYSAHQTDLRAFWSAVGDEFGPAAAKRLEVDAKLSALTINNLPLMTRLHATGGGNGITDLEQLARSGYHSPQKWHDEILTAAVTVPKEIGGDTDDDRRANYAAYLAGRVRVSYPTASVAQMVESGALQLAAKEPVARFLFEHAGEFDIGMMPVERFVRTKELDLHPDTLAGVKRLQRVHQITPSDEAMAGLLAANLDSAYAIVQTTREDFMAGHGAALGGAAAAREIYDRALDVHHAVFNVAISYLTAKSSIAVGGSPAGDATIAMSGGQILEPAPPPPGGGDVLAYPTLEKLFGSMDFCACEECRSILSPAAYLVDLLQFIDRAPSEAGKRNPLDVLRDRRPDIENLPLTCENTNTVLPSIDIVNEILEYFVARGSLAAYEGHDTGDAESADLLASPQYVVAAAYNDLRDIQFPPPLPFHQQLELLRRHFRALKIPLPVAMEMLRQTDDVDRGANRYGWRDILSEEIGMSREESEGLTNAAAVTLPQLYGFPNGTPESTIIEELSHAKRFCRRTGITYEDLVAILRTRFVNPDSDLLPRLERLAVSFAEIVELKLHGDDARFDSLLPAGGGKPDPADYGNDIKAWLKDDGNFSRIAKLITLAGPSTEPEVCDFDNFLLHYVHADPATGGAAASAGSLAPSDFIRLQRFIRLWKKLGWTIEQTDLAISALQDPAAAGLDALFQQLLPRLGIAVRVMKTLDLRADRDLPSLLALWSDIGTHGEHSLYHRMFLSAAALKLDAVFAPNAKGEYLAEKKKLHDHAEALRAAFHLTADEYDRIVAALGYSAETPLQLSTISAIYRRAYLARTLRISVRELLSLMAWTELDPFVAPDPAAPAPPILRLISLVRRLKERSLKPAMASYLFAGDDPSGRLRTDPAQVAELARSLRADFAAIDDELAAGDDASGDIARARLALVYGQEATDAFFALLEDTIRFDVPIVPDDAFPASAIVAVDPRIVYDPFRQRLGHTGLIADALAAALKGVAGMTPRFAGVIDDLAARSKHLEGSFFTRFAELRPLYDTFHGLASDQRSGMLAMLRPELSKRRKRQQALQRLADSAGVDPLLTRMLVDGSAAPFPLHAASDPARPAIDDVLALERPGLRVRFYDADRAGGTEAVAPSVTAELSYSTAGPNRLHENTTAGAAISAIWDGRLEAPESGYFNIIVDADAGAAVTLRLGIDRPLTRDGNLWRNAGPIELAAGTLYEFQLTVERVKDVVRVQWETPRRNREVIAGRQLYPPAFLGPFSDLYARFLKAASLAKILQLTPGELTWLATHPDHQIGGDGFLNVLGVAAGAPIPALIEPLEALLDFARIKAEVSPDDERLLETLRDPVSAAAAPEKRLDGVLRSNEASVSSLLTHFVKTLPDLGHLSVFSRFYDASELVRASGIPAAALIAAATNDPNSDGTTVRDLQTVLRAPYAAADWRDLLRPINDEMRALQRDALVAHILHRMRSNPSTRHIDTADKLFEYFLTDVQMEPCMETSRIRHALSSVQLFIERCLMNLETEVSPRSIDARQWEVRKRYRVDRANLLVALRPENWLEEELRDDKSPIFKEIESELLQTDITEEAAASAVITYLTRLEEVAKLEPCAIFHEEENRAERRDAVQHVVGRTAGAHRKYFYRRREHGYWTPWEEIKLEIEDNPVLPVVWNGRLLLFWLRVGKHAAPNLPAQPSDRSTPLTALTIAHIPGAPTTTTTAILCWSEFVNGKWQPAKTSDVAEPALIDDSDVPRADITLSAQGLGETLILVIGVSDRSRAAFTLFNTHSLPSLSRSVGFVDFGQTRRIARGTFTYRDSLWGSSIQRKVLTDATAPAAVTPRHPMAYPWDAPFLMSDSRHAFHVTTTEHLVLLIDLVPPFVHIPVTVLTGIPPLIAAAATVIPPQFEVDPRFVVPPRPPTPMERFVAGDSFLRVGIDNLASVDFGGTKIGPAGAIANVRGPAR